MSTKCNYKSVVKKCCCFKPFHIEIITLIVKLFKYFITSIILISFSFDLLFEGKPKEDFNNLKLSIKKDGIHWKYKVTENRQSKEGIIPFSELK